MTQTKTLGEGEQGYDAAGRLPECRLPGTCPSRKDHTLNLSAKKLGADP